MTHKPDNERMIEAFGNFLVAKLGTHPEFSRLVNDDSGDWMRELEPHLKPYGVTVLDYKEALVNWHCEETRMAFFLEWFSV